MSKKETRQQKKLSKQFLDALSEKVIPSGKPGAVENMPSRKPTTKQRRHKGWKTPAIIFPTMKYSKMIKNALEPTLQYDDWEDFRDGARHNSDKTHFYSKWAACCLSEEEVYQINKKIKKQRAIRKAKLEK